MKKILFFFCCILYIQLSNAQQSVNFTFPDILFYEGQSMFNDKNYAGCIDKITLYKKYSLGSNLIQEADFLLASSSFHQNDSNVIDKLMNFLDIYPQTLHKDKIYFMIGMSFFNKQDYDKTEAWFNKTNIDLLSVAEQENYIYNTGISLLQKENYDEAVRFFSALNHQYSNKYKDLSRYYLAYISYKKENYNHALNGFLQLKGHPILRQDVLYYIIHILFIQKKYAQVIDEGKSFFKDHVKNNTHNTDIKKLIGIASYYTNNYSKTIQYLTPIAKKSIQEYLILGISYYHLKKYDKAIEYLNKSNPSNDILGQSIYVYLGQSYLQLKDNDKALHSFEVASRMDLDSLTKETATYNYIMLLYENSTIGFEELIKMMENFTNTYPHSIYRDKISNTLIEVYLTTQNYEAALASISKIEFPGEKLLELKQKIYYYLGTVSFTNKKYDSAIDYFNYAITTDAHTTEKNLSIYWRGESQYRKGNYVLAEKDYQNYAQTADKSTNLAVITDYNLGYCSFKQKDYEKARQFFESFTNKTSNNRDILFDAYTRLGDCYLNDRKFNEAEHAYDTIINILPSASDYAIFQKGCIMGLQKDYQGKINQMDKLIENFPNSPYIVDAIYEKGHACILANDRATAIKTYQTLLYKYPESNLVGQAGLQLGLLYYNDNQPQKAIAIYKHIISNYPESIEAKEAIQDLKSIYFDINDIVGYAEYIKSLGSTAELRTSEQDSLVYLASERLFLKKDITQAQNALNNYLQMFPNGVFSTNAHYYLANIYYDQKKYDLSRKEYAKILDAGNTQFMEEAAGRTAEMQYNNKEYENALQAYKTLKDIATNKTNRDAGIVGIMRSANHLNNYNDIIASTDLLLEDNMLNPEIITEAKYHRAKSYLALGDNEKAKLDLNDLSENTQNIYGAEAYYLLAKLYFDEGKSQEAQTITQNYIQQGTIHIYWLAKSFILLSDIYAADNDKLQARQYLESLQANYKNTDDDIHSIIQERLSRL